MTDHCFSFMGNPLHINHSIKHELPEVGHHVLRLANAMRQTNDVIQTLQTLQTLNHVLDLTSDKRGQFQHLLEEISTLLQTGDVLKDEFLIAIDALLNILEGELNSNLISNDYLYQATNARDELVSARLTIEHVIFLLRAEQAVRSAKKQF